MGLRLFAKIQNNLRLELWASKPLSRVRGCQRKACVRRRFKIPHPVCASVTAIARVEDGTDGLFARGASHLIVWQSLAVAKRCDAASPKQPFVNPAAFLRLEGRQRGTNGEFAGLHQWLLLAVSVESDRAAYSIDMLIRPKSLDQEIHKCSNFATYHATFLMHDVDWHRGELELV